MFGIVESPFPFLLLAVAISVLTMAGLLVAVWMAENRARAKWAATYLKNRPGAQPVLAGPDDRLWRRQYDHRFRHRWSRTLSE